MNTWVFTKGMILKVSAAAPGAQWPMNCHGPLLLVFSSKLEERTDICQQRMDYCCQAMTKD